MQGGAVQAVCELAPGSSPWPQLGPCKQSWSTRSQRGGVVLGRPRAGPSPWDCLHPAPGGASLISRAAGGRGLHWATGQLGRAQAGPVMGVAPLWCRKQAVQVGDRACCEPPPLWAGTCC